MSEQPTKDTKGAKPKTTKVRRPNPEPFGLYLRIQMVGCGLANVDEREVAERDEKGNPIAFRVVPKSWKLHSPCPWDQEPVTDKCRFCSFHTEATVLMRPIKESVADKIQEAEPGAWESAMPKPFPKPGRA